MLIEFGCKDTAFLLINSAKALLFLPVFVVFVCFFSSVPECFFQQGLVLENISIFAL